MGEGGHLVDLGGGLERKVRPRYLCTCVTREQQLGREAEVGGGASGQSFWSNWLKGLCVLVLRAPVSHASSSRRGKLKLGEGGHLVKLVEGRVRPRSSCTCVTREQQQGRGKMGGWLCASEEVASGTAPHARACKVHIPSFSDAAECRRSSQAIINEAPPHVN